MSETKINEKLKELILEVEDGIEENSLSKHDILNYKDKTKNLSRRLNITISNKEGDYGKLSAARFHELNALMFHLERNPELVEDELKNVYKFMPANKDLVSNFAKKMISNGINSVGYYSPRKMTLSDHKQAIGEQTPGELTKNIVAIIVIIIVVLFGMIVTFQQIFPSY